MVKTWLTQAAKSISRRSMSLAHTARRLVIDKRRLSVLVAALITAVGLAACGPSSPGDSPSPSGTQSTDSYTPYDEPTDSYTPYDEPTDSYTPSDEPTDSYTPSDQTNGCDYGGDPTCPNARLTLPPPNFSAPY